MKKLKLHRETLRTLSTLSLEIAGGSDTEKTRATVCFYISCVECPTDVGCTRSPDTDGESYCYSHCQGCEM